MRLPIATTLAVALAFLLLLVPALGRNHLEIAAAAALGLALVGLARWPHGFERCADGAAVIRHDLRRAGREGGLGYI